MAIIILMLKSIFHAYSSVSNISKWKQALHQGREKRHTLVKKDGKRTTLSFESMLLK